MDKKCISQCYNNNTKNINPTYLNFKCEKFNFCFDDILNKESTAKCNNNDITSLLPIINLEENNILELVYKIKSWEDCNNYIKKYQNLSNKKTIERIINYSWISFFEKYKVNIDLIIEIYSIFSRYFDLKIDNNKIKENIYKLKDENTSKQKFHKLLFELLKK